MHVHFSHYKLWGFWQLNNSNFLCDNIKYNQIQLLGVVGLELEAIFRSFKKP